MEFLTLQGYPTFTTKKRPCPIADSDIVRCESRTMLYAITIEYTRQAAFNAIPIVDKTSKKDVRSVHSLVVRNGEHGEQ